MTQRKRPETQPLGDGNATAWTDARGRLAAADYYWLATVHSDGRPHVRPLLAVWVADAMYFCSGAATRKSGYLTAVPSCSLATETDTFHFVVEGEATKRSDETALQDVAGAYATKYEWEVEVRDGAFYAAGAPTAGEPPYEVYEVTPETVFGFGLDASVSSTRWQFE
ncbi:pyridoxamine 5'-phosphate oxidase family protein [Natrialba asiatica]|uniref:Pyridoxamine 5'-phosphate oxidase-related FMN-binding protein n=1 Tax=Natrialba asiatica (strain ATCC 700177 / DSM 12278 / JCM 9576 / FERM P-10747 / NBRC 102637 / 172P1) TaxID=29540 RepID=M0AQ37_NATA1|nr:pyridoxamine 5'-phosphate oxidase family protein [Natrialba asiatica]ELZ00028.1 pyridoxamine 5'-phosphate oxidase-related FMN- binding protein [Natrialba asiatica DSM 12278]